MIIEACAEILGLPQALLLPGEQENLFLPYREKPGDTKGATHVNYEEKLLSNRTRVWFGCRRCFCFAGLLVALSRQVRQRRVYLTPAWLSSDFAGAHLAESSGVTKSCLDVVGGRPVVCDYSHHPGRSFLLNSDADRNSEETFGLGSARPARAS